MSKLNGICNTTTIKSAICVSKSPNVCKGELDVRVAVRKQELSEIERADSKVMNQQSTDVFDGKNQIGGVVSQSEVNQVVELEVVTYNDIILRLSKLSFYEYELFRRDEAKRLKIRVATLDKFYTRSRKVANMPKMRGLFDRLRK